MLEGQYEKSGESQEKPDTEQSPVDQVGNQLAAIGIEDLLPEGIAAIEDPLAAMVEEARRRSRPARCR